MLMVLNNWNDVQVFHTTHLCCSMLEARLPASAALACSPVDSPAVFPREAEFEKFCVWIYWLELKDSRLRIEYQESRF